jgi:ribosomal protein L11 methyltransferase
MELWETRAEIAPGAAGPVEHSLLESGFGGWTLLEDAVAGRAWIIGIFEGRAEAESRWAELRAALPVEPMGEALTRRLPDADWKNSYREHFKAWAFGRLHWVPVWERESFRLPAGHSALWLDPGMAFGTGNHETTRLCVERLVEFEAALAAGAGRMRAVDAGCGSGILALSASLLGFGDVCGFDNDPEAVRVSLGNAELNGMSGRVRFSTAGLPEGLDGGPSDVLMANLQADILVRHRGDLAAAVAPGGILALGGILASEAGTVREAFESAAPGWACDSRVLGEWCDLCLRRPAR